MKDSSIEIDYKYLREPEVNNALYLIDVHVTLPDANLIEAGSTHQYVMEPSIDIEEIHELVLGSCYLCDTQYVRDRFNDRTIVYVFDSMLGSELL